MNEEFRIGRRPGAPQGQRSSPQQQVAARVGNYISALPQGDPEVAGLIAGLSQLSPQVQHLADIQHKDAVAKVGESAKADAEKVDDPLTALNSGEVEVPYFTPPAVADNYKQAFQAALSQRAGQRIKADMAAEYATASLRPDFNQEQWLSEHRQKSLAGLADPRTVTIMGSHLGEVEAQIRQDGLRRTEAKRVAAANSALAQDAADRFTPDASPQAVLGAFVDFETRAVGLGKTSADAVASVFHQTLANSAKLGGAPDLFDVFDEALPDGRTLRTIAPALSDHLDRAKAQARAQYDKRRDEANIVRNGKTLDMVERAIETTPATVTPEFLAPYFGPHNVIESPEKYASILARARNSEARLNGVDASAAFAERGELFRLPSDAQQDHLNARLNDRMTGMLDLVRANDSGKAAQAMSELVKSSLSWGANVPFKQLAGFVQTHITTVPSKDGPSAGFAATAEMYKALSAAPNLRDQYFPGDAGQLMSAYTSAERAGSSAAAAYSGAYASNDPAARKVAAEFAKTPEGLKLVSEKMAKHVEGVSAVLPGWFFGDTVKNTRFVAAEGSTHLHAMLSRNPHMTDDQIADGMKSWYSSNFILDTTSGMAIKVPPAPAAGPHSRRSPSSPRRWRRT